MIKVIPVVRIMKTPEKRVVRGYARTNSAILNSLSPASGERAGVRGPSSDVVRQFDPLTLTLSPDAGEREPRSPNQFLVSDFVFCRAT